MCFERGKEDVWIVLDLDKRGQRVFDVTYYLDEHPGGPEILQEVAGLSGWEATDDFFAIGHSEDASFDAEQFCIGRLEGGAHRDASGAIHPVAVHPGLLFRHPPTTWSAQLGPLAWMQQTQRYLRQPWATLDWPRIAGGRIGRALLCWLPLSRWGQLYTHAAEDRERLSPGQISNTATQ